MKRRHFLQFATACSSWLLGTRAGAAAEPQAQPPADEISWSRSVPVRYQADVAVIGGGIAGVAAACAAARSGAKVVLVERFAVTGGNMTSGGVANFCGQLTGQGEVFDAILTELRRFKAIEEKKAVFHYEILAIVLQEMLLERGVKLLLHTRFVDAIEKDGSVRECIVCGKSGPEAIRATQFIDCSGEADLARACGFATVKGRPEDGLQLPMSVMYFVRHVEPKDAFPQLPEGCFEPVRTKKDLPMTSIWPDGPRSNAIKVKIPMFDSTDTESLSRAEIRARRRMMEVLDYHQRVEEKPWRLDHCSPIIGIREGCRVVGDYTLLVDDLRAARRFDDAIARGTFYLDGHKPDDDKRTYILSHDEMQVPPYQIPFRSLLVRDARNLLAAGRCFSADQLALSSARVSTTCSMLGQAAGIAAAEAVKKGCDPRDLDPALVRKTVESRGAELAV
ncbi:MAG: FAD-dependent oxidoreductase [Thermoguttaceae bacterium]